MRIVIAALGSRGDVVPYLDPAARLRAAGHEVTIAANSGFADVVGGADGDRFAPLAGDARTIADFGAGWRTSPRSLAHQAAALTDYLCAAADDLVEVAAGADLLLVNVAAQFGHDIAEGLGIRSAGVFAQPIEPTRAFPPMLLHTARPLGGAGNLVAGRVALAAAAPFHKAAARVRHRLGLAPRSFAAGLRARRRGHWPVLHGWSPHVLPRPADWRSGLEVVGYWNPPVPPGWTPPPALTRFLAAGPAPIWVGFGSMAPGQGEELAPVVEEALRRSEVRAVVGRGWAGLDVAGPDVLVVDDVPHAWLFPRLAAVVHHGGAGTAGATFTAGVPAVTVPVYADQPLWGARAHRLGVGPAPLPMRALTAASLAERITAATGDPRHRLAAGRLAARIAGDDGAGRVVARVAEWSPLRRRPAG